MTCQWQSAISQHILDATMQSTVLQKGESKFLTQTSKTLEVLLVFTCDVQRVDGLALGIGKDDEASMRHGQHVIEKPAGITALQLQHLPHKAAGFQLLRMLIWLCSHAQVRRVDVDLQPGDNTTLAVTCSNCSSASPLSPYSAKRELSALPATSSWAVPVSASVAAVQASEPRACPPAGSTGAPAVTAPTSSELLPVEGSSCGSRHRRTCAWAHPCMMLLHFKRLASVRQ